MIIMKTGWVASQPNITPMPLSMLPNEILLGSGAWMELFTRQARKVRAVVKGNKML